MRSKAGDRGELTRARILEAARSLAPEHGYKGTTLAMIQKKAGVHPGSLYWFFADKDELFAHLIEYSLAEAQRTAPELPAGLATDNPVKAALLGIVENPARYGLWRFNVQFMVAPELPDSKTAHIIRRLRVETQNAMTSAWLARLPEAVVTAEPHLARRLAEHALVTVEGCILARVAGRPVDEDAVTTATTSTLDALVAAACARVGVPTPDFIARRSWARDPTDERNTDGLA